MPAITREMLAEFIDDTLSEEDTAAVEKALRTDVKVWALFEEVQRQDADRGEHSVGAIWRRDKLSCPTRDQLGGYHMQAIDPDHADYIAFHLETVGCPACRANLEDLRQKQAEAANASTGRRKRIVKSGAGVLREVDRRA